MRIYLCGTVSNGEASEFIPSDLYFATEECDDNLIPGEDCMEISGLSVESSVERNNWNARWKGVEVTNEENYGEDITADDIVKLINERKLSLSNMSGYLDTDEDEEAYVKVTKMVIVDDTGEFEIEPDLLKEEIEFL